MVTNDAARGALSERMQETECVERVRCACSGEDLIDRHHVYDWLIHSPAPVASGLTTQAGQRVVTQPMVILIGACKYCGRMVATDMAVPS